MSSTPLSSVLSERGTLQPEEAAKPPFPQILTHFLFASPSPSRDGGGQEAGGRREANLSPLATGSRTHSPIRSWNLELCFPAFACPDQKLEPRNVFPCVCLWSGLHCIKAHASHPESSVTECPASSLAIPVCTCPSSSCTPPRVGYSACPLRLYPPFLVSGGHCSQRKPRSHPFPKF